MEKYLYNFDVKQKDLTMYYSFFMTEDTTSKVKRYITRQILHITKVVSCYYMKRLFRLLGEIKAKEIGSSQVKEIQKANILVNHDSN